MGGKFALAPRTSEKSPFIMDKFRACLENSPYPSFTKSHISWFKESIIVSDFNKTDLLYQR